MPVSSSSNESVNNSDANVKGNNLLHYSVWNKNADKGLSYVQQKMDVRVRRSVECWQGKQHWLILKIIGNLYKFVNYLFWIIKYKMLHVNEENQRMFLCKIKKKVHTDELWTVA